MSQSKQPKLLKKGDTIAIIAPAKAIDELSIQFSKTWLEVQGFKVLLGKHVLGNHHYYSGTIGERLSDMQTALDDENVKAILCARGGYGSVQIVDRINWSGQLSNPKWILGFSDITVFHQRNLQLNIQTIHSSMPLNFQENTEDALDTLINSITEGQNNYSIEPNKHNLIGEAKGKLVGGNLSILYSLLGTNDQIDYEDCILYIEDLAEQLYSLDRMFYAFQKAGVLDQINGLIVGGMTDMKDTAVSIGKTYQEIILEHFKYSSIPVCFNFPAGHIHDNRTLILGKRSKLSVKENGVVLEN